MHNVENCQRVECGIQVRKSSCKTMGRVRVRNHSASVFHILPVGNFPHFAKSAFYPRPTIGRGYVPSCSAPSTCRVARHVLGDKLLCQKCADVDSE